MRKPLLLTLLLVLAVPILSAEQIKLPSNVVVAHIDTIVTTAIPTTRTAVAAKDGETGELRAPSADEMKELAHQISVMQLQKRRLPAAQVKTASDGTLSSTLDESYENLTIVIKSEDGDAIHACVDGAESAIHFLLRARQPKAPAQGEK